MMRFVMTIAVSLILVSVFAGNHYAGSRDTPKKGKVSDTTVIADDYSTIQGCLASIKAKSGSSLKIITNEPSSQVSGFLSNGEHFACMKKESESKGTYIDGWYTVK